jgi:spore maturation protein SpmB
MYSFKYNQQDATTFFIAIYALHISGGFSTHHQELKTVHTEFGVCQTCLLLPLARGRSNSATLAVAASKLDIYQMLCVKF